MNGLESTVSTNQTVVLIHGLGGQCSMMRSVADRLGELDYNVVPFNYRSLVGRLEEHSERFLGLLQSLEKPGSVTHLVGHSFGCIVARAALSTELTSTGRGLTLGRFVMLCPPNRGSHVARRLSLAVGRFLPAFRDLSDQSDSTVNRLPKTIADRIDVGIILAEGDLVVRPSSAKLPGVKDYALVPGMHSAVFRQRQTPVLVESFLRVGDFGKLSIQ
jgi:pimeloyl-ACP methyl ester carboxylesterase